ncbi:MAG: Tm-1-like ATP-binding domain-containing protein, partial [Gemmataceae bacterium]
MAVLLIGTLDTKGVELQFVRDILLRAGLPCLVMDAGILQPPTFAPDIPREKVFEAAGSSIEKVRSRADRGEAITLAAEGAAILTHRLHREGTIEGVLGMGGSAGTTIASAAMRALPFGVPKVMLSTLASGQVKPYVGVRDLTMMYSVVDLCGLNRISRTVLANAAQALVGMVQGRSKAVAPSSSTDRPLVTATMFGVTTPCVDRARQHVESTGYEVLVFHATGTGGQTME